MKISKRNKIIAVMMAVCLCAVVTLSLTQSQVVYNPPVTGEIDVSAGVKQIFERACYDCHSNETDLRWFDKLPVISSIIAKDVMEARKRFNFSEWDKLSAVEQKGLLWEIFNMVNAGKMPLKSYTATHPNANISKTDLSVIKNYLNTLRVPNISDTVAALPRQSAQVDDIPVSVNGIKHMPEYRDWEVMSTTSRFDNGSMRLMYANPIAMQAIRSGHINPWPQGSIIVKVVWEKLEDGEGNIRPGKLVNIQYMVRDTEKFKDTEGWGFARFDSPDLKPYGTLASLKKCIACHQAVKENGFVFDLSTKNNL